MPISHVAYALLVKMDAVIRWQMNGRFHPLTCGNYSGHGLLLPVVDWDAEEVHLKCPDCDYVQTTVPAIVTAMGGPDGSDRG